MKNKQIIMRATEEEYQMLHEIAEKECKSVTSIIFQALNEKYKSDGYISESDEEKDLILKKENLILNEEDLILNEDAKKYKYKENFYNRINDGCMFETLRVIATRCKQANVEISDDTKKILNDLKNDIVNGMFNWTSPMDAKLKIYKKKIKGDDLYD